MVTIPRKQACIEGIDFNGKCRLAMLSEDPETLMALSKDPIGVVRSVLASSNIHLEEFPKVLECIRKDRDYVVRYNLIGNRTVSDEILKSMAKEDQSFYVRDAARKELTRRNPINESFEAVQISGIFP